MMLLALISWPYARRHLLRTALTVTGIVLGVAVFVAMHTANESVLSAFSDTIDRIAGRTELQITAGDAGFPEDVLERVQASPLVRVAVPVIEAVVESTLPGQGTVLVLAVDMTGDRSLREYDLAGGEDAIIDDPLMFLAQPDSIIISRELADRHHLRVGDALPLRTSVGEKRFTIRGIMQSSGLATAFGGNLAVMDVYAAQFMFGRGRTFDRIDVALKPGVPIETAQRQLTSVLGRGFDIDPPATRGRQAEATLAGYGVMVNISSAFALFVGIFIVYNALAIAVTQRRAEIGILRALGASRAQVRWLFLGESLLFGFVGSSLGLGLGVVVARSTASVMSRLAGDLYGLPQRIGDVSAHPVILLAAFVVGLATSLIAATVPAGNAANLDPVQALQKGRSDTAPDPSRRPRFWLGLLATGLSLACVSAAGVRAVFYAGYALSIAALVLWVPLAWPHLARAIRPLLKSARPVEGALAADSLIQAPDRTSATVLALTLSLAMVVGFAGMARASYGSILEWMNTTLNPDLIVTPSARLDLRTARYPESMATEIAQIAGVARVQMFRFTHMSYRGERIMLLALEMNSIAQTTRTRPVAGNPADMYRRAADGQGVIVSDNFSEAFGATLGTTIDIPAPYGTVRLPVVGIIVDYTDQKGTVFVDRSVFLRYWRDTSVSDFRVFVKPPASIADVRQRIIDRFAGTRQLFVLTSEESRRYVSDIAAQWFGLMYVQVAVAVFVAVLGIVNSLTVSITDRRRELGVLRAVGALKGQVRRTIWLEALAVAALGLVLGCVFGAINLYYVLDIVERDVSGLRLDYEYPIATVLALIPTILVSAFGAAIWPAESAVRMPLSEALEYE